MGTRCGYMWYVVGKMGTSCGYIGYVVGKYDTLWVTDIQDVYPQRIYTTIILCSTTYTHTVNLLSKTYNLTLWVHSIDCGQQIIHCGYTLWARGNSRYTVDNKLNVVGIRCGYPNVTHNVYKFVIHNVYPSVPTTYTHNVFFLLPTTYMIWYPHRIPNTYFFVTHNVYESVHNVYLIAPTS